MFPFSYCKRQTSDVHVACGFSLLNTFLKYDLMPQKVKYDAFIYKYLKRLRAKTII